MLSIGIGSKTSTGGSVIEGNSGILFDGLVASSVGHKATCPACKKGVGEIVAVGARTTILPAGPAARAGDYVACGCPPGANKLIAKGTVNVGAEAGNGVARVDSSLAAAAKRSLLTGSFDANQPIAKGQDTNIMHVEASDVFFAVGDSSENPDSRDVLLNYQLDAQEFNLRQVAFLPAEGVGVNGTFFIKGSLSLSGRELFISAMGFTAADHMGTVHFQAAAKVLIDGRQILSTPLVVDRNEAGLWPNDQYVPIGSAVLTLPAPELGNVVQVVISGGYIYSAPEGSAVPIPPTGAVTIPLPIVKAK
ncbi:PAAR domain-containing protein [Halopseudomonas pelagia]|uniref:PAAR domain-containing protein n=1 Tax=Halopseudomonas pelagia TaxID=553151 RepID=A0AA91U4R3_9GAMM|nr:PAAR domain-containing protein [Halopseudomonas pelagia]PCD00500.1 hypothetical protein CO192_04740 [Halopseudomonas pelagia]QFY55203.1 PAAR domain-containing protein [Halopseudomonas pelagia]